MKDIKKAKEANGIKPRHHNIIGYTDSDLLEFGKYISGLSESDVFSMLIKFLVSTQDNTPEFAAGSDEDSLF